MTPTAIDPISDELIETVCTRLAQGKAIRQALPGDGVLHIDRQLPFLCVYRCPTRRPDPGTEQLVTGEAAHLIAPDSPQLKAELSHLVEAIARTLAAKFGAFLIIEVWAKKNEAREELPQPRFQIVSSNNRPPTATLEALEIGLHRIRILKQRAEVSVAFNRNRTPAGASMLISSAKARQLNCFLLGLEVQPVYRRRDTNEIFPMVLRTLHRGLSTALKQAFFEFSRTQTNLRPVSYQALGRRAVVKSVWHVDRRLARISNSFDFLLQVTPVNIEAAWHQFKKRRFERPPTFYYRPLPLDPALLMRELYNIRLERIEDPTLSFLFREKRLEVDRQLSMLSDRGSRRFLYGSLQLFGGVSAELLQLSTEILQKIPPRSRERSRGEQIGAAEFAKLARVELDYYRKFLPELAATVHVRNDTVGLMVSQGNLLIGQSVKVHPSRVEALLQHEIGTHVLTYYNGRAQPFQQLYTGLAGYEELQEGIAVLAEYLVGGLSRPRLRLLAGRVLAAHCLVDGASFTETFRILNHKHGFDQKTAFTITTRIYRGGGLTKDAVYLRGLVGVLKYLHEGGEISPLFVGKIATDHIPIIKELQWRQVLRPVPLRPRYMENPQALTRLDKLRKKTSVLNLIER